MGRAYILLLLLVLAVLWLLVSFAGVAMVGSFSGDPGYGEERLRSNSIMWTLSLALSAAATVGLAIYGALILIRSGRS